jgi:hypothetical protein
LLPQFTCRDGAWSISAQIGAMGLVQIINSAVIYSLVGAGARIVLGTRPRVAHMVSQFSGAAMIVIALVLLIEPFLALKR